MSHFQKIAADGTLAANQATDHAAVIDTRTGLMWSTADIGERVPFKKCADACKGLNIAGFTDWRMPTVEELLLLADRSKFNPAIDTDAFPACKGGWYWTSTVDASSPSVFAWSVLFDDGDASCLHQGNDGRARAVRSVAPASPGQ